MRMMKESHVEWIGKIPIDWDIVKGKYILKCLQKPIKEDDGVITCFRDGEVTLRSNRREEGFTLSDKEIGYQGIDVGDLVVHGMDGFAGAIGISDSRGKASPVLNVLDSFMDKKYLMYYLRSMAYGDVFLSIATGIRVRSCDLRWNKLAELPYPVPKVIEQKKISSFLNGKCEEIDALSEDIQSEINTLEEYKRSVISEVIKTGLDKNIQKKDSGVDYIGLVPNGWEVKRLKYVLAERNFRSETGSEKLLSVSQYLGVVPSDTIQRTMKADSLIGYKKVYPKDLVFNKLNPVLARFGVSQYTGITSPDFAVYHTKQADTRFLCYLLRTDTYITEYGRICTGVGEGFSRLYTPMLFNIKVALPSINEQERIADYLDKKCKEIAYIISKKKEQLELLSDYKKTIIYEYVTGKKEVPSNQ